MKTAAKILFFITGAVAIALTAHSCWTFDRDDPPCPKINSFAPKGGAFGEEITITGEGFFEGLSNLHIVKIGNNTIVPEEDVTVLDGKTIKFKVPKGAENGAISVTLKTALDCPGVSKEEFTYYYTATLVKRLIGMQTDINCEGCLNYPAGLDTDTSGNIIVADKLRHRICKYNASGTFSSSYGNGVPNCNADPTNSIVASFNEPLDVEVDPGGNVYVADNANSVIRKFSSATVPSTIERYAGKCNSSLFNDGSCTNSSGSARISSPYSLVKDDNNTIYLADNGTLRKIDDPCNITTMIYDPAYDFRAIAISRTRINAGEGPLFVTDAKGKKVYSVNLNGLSSPVAMDQALLDMPQALTLDSKGNIFIADSNKHQVFVIYNNGAIRILAGTGASGYTDGVAGKDARFMQPSGIAINPAKPNLVYVSDSGNHVVRCLTIE